MGLFDGVRRLLRAGEGDRDAAGASGPADGDAADVDWATVEATDAGEATLEPEQWDGSSLPPPERFAEEAAEFVEFSPKNDLDFAPTSLAHLDEFVDREWDEARFRNLDPDDDVSMDQLVFEGLTIQLGSYFGELFVRTHDAASWVDHEGSGWVVVVDGPDAALEVTVFEVAQESLRGPATFEASYDAVVARTGIGSVDSAAATDEHADAGSGSEDDPVEDDPGPHDDATGSTGNDGKPTADEFVANATSSNTVGETEVPDATTGDRSGRSVANTTDLPDEQSASEPAANPDDRRSTTGGRAVDRPGSGPAGVDLPGRGATPAEFEEWADVLAAEFPDRGLDGSPSSLDAVDELIASELPALASLDEDTRGDLVRAVGAYVGETLRTARDGTWHYRDGAWVVDVEIGGDRSGVDPFGTVRRALRGEGRLATGGAGPGDDVDGDDSGDMDGTSGRPAPDPAAEDADVDANDDGSPRTTAAARARSFAADWPGYDLDFAPGSLARLDDLAAEEFGHLRGGEGATGELVEAATAFGAYLGEVLRRHHGGRWADRDGPAVVLPGRDDEEVDVDVIRIAATRLVGDGSFAALYDRATGRQTPARD